MENFVDTSEEKATFSRQSISSELSLGDSVTEDTQFSTLENNRVKRKSKKRNTITRKTKPSPVLKVDEETVTTGSCNRTNTPEYVEHFSVNSNSSSEDDSLLTHIVLTQILARKRLELLETEEIKNIINSKIAKK